jgi:hypothetical protein
MTGRLGLNDGAGYRRPSDESLNEALVSPAGDSRSTTPQPPTIESRDNLNPEPHRSLKNSPPARKQPLIPVEERAGAAELCPGAA